MEITDRIFQFGRYSPLITLDDGNGMRMSFPAEISDQDVLNRVLEIVTGQQAEDAYNAIETVSFNILDHAELIKEFVLKIKATPNVTLNQYNTWLTTKTWYQASVIRYFVFVLATKLADKNGITLSDLTENQVLQKLRDWIVATSLKTIGKVIGYGSSGD